MQYVYPAIFYKAIEGGYIVEFPDIAGAITQADSLIEAVNRAEDSLAYTLTMYEDNLLDNIKLPSDIEKIKPELDEYSTGAFTTLIKADTDKYRESISSLN